jgi:hypothetical protein
MQKTSAEFKLKNNYISIDYAPDGTIRDCTIQEKDGTVLFTGTIAQLSEVVVAANEIINEIVIEDC